ncbi:MAG: endonuclease [Bacteroidaceae bacterium]
MSTSINKTIRRSLVLTALLLCATNINADIPEDYYSQADGLKKEILKQALHDIVGKANVLDYGSGAGSTWSGFYKTDRMENNQVRDRYSYEVFYFTSTSSAPAGMNIEHSFPKSWWGGSKNQAYCDLFNLMPCETNINSKKSNYAMGKVTSGASGNGCTTVGRDSAGRQVWEPADEWKGDFARNYFYMVTAYSNLTWTSNGLDMLDNNDWPTLQTWAYELLLEWSRQDPVDNIERERNEAVYNIQGNRNPFVDYPNLAEYIWGDSITFAFSVNGSSQGGDTNPPVDPIEPDREVVLCNENFCTSQGEWTIINVELSGLDYVWCQDSQYGMKASAYAGGTTYATESWLISPEYDLTGMASAELVFSHTGKFFGTMTKEATLWVSTDNGNSWNQVDIEKYMTGNNWTFVTSTQDLSSLCGNHIRLAFRYTSTTEAAGTWEIKTVKLTAQKTTGIPAAPDKKEWRNGVYTYDLSGRHANDSQRGLVIHNGKKILRK